MGLLCETELKVTFSLERLNMSEHAHLTTSQGTTRRLSLAGHFCFYNALLAEKKKKKRVNLSIEICLRARDFLYSYYLISKPELLQFIRDYGKENQHHTT